MTDTAQPSAPSASETSSRPSVPETTKPIPVLHAALAGLLAAGAALATGEVLSGFSQKIPSLVVGVGEIFTDETPGGVVRWSIDTFGTSQKTLLIWGISIAALIVGAILGIASRTNPRTGVIGFAAFGLLGGWAASRAALSNNALSWFSAGLAAIVGIVVLRLLLARLPLKAVPEGANPVFATSQRRAFFGIVGGAAFWAVFGTGLGRALRRGQNVEAARDQIAASLGVDPAAAPTSVTLPGSLDDVPGISPLVTPSDNFYLIDTALRKPQVDPATWSMKITGMVDEEIEFTYDDLAAMDQVEEVITLSCVSNEVGGGLVGNAIWTGVRLDTLLNMAGVQEGATQVVGRSVDGWTGGFPTEIALDGRPAMVALTMNGEPLPVKHGFPARLVVPGLYGYVSATKWLSEIQLTTWEDFDGYWIPRGWSKEGPIKTQSRIDVPANGTTVPAGPTAIAGVAWAPHRSVSKVEVSFDGDTWFDARLSDEPSSNAWRQWVYEFDAPAGDHVVAVRATDGEGNTQTPERTAVAPDGATGWHTIAFRAQ